MKWSNSIAQNMRDPIERLPDDLLITIFSSLPFREVIAAQRVSRGWLHYLVTNPYLLRYVSFLNSKHPITLKTLRTVIAVSQGRILSLEFNADTFMHLTPLVPVYPHLQELTIEHETGIMGTIFNIAFQSAPSTYYNLPNLRAAIFKHGMLLNNEVVILLSMAPNLEEFECRSSLVDRERIDSLEKTAYKLKKLRIAHYSERTNFQTHTREQSHGRLLRSPAILRLLPLLEELVLGIDALQVLDLTLNPMIRYLDLLPRSPVLSFIQPPPSLEVCLNAPQLNRFLPDTYPPVWPPSETETYHIGLEVQLWNTPPRFKQLSTCRVLMDTAILPQALSNSYDSLQTLRLNFGKQIPETGIFDAQTRLLTDRQLEMLPDLLVLFHNLRGLDVSESSADNSFLERISGLSLEYLALARTLVTSKGVVKYLMRAQGKLKVLNVAGTDVGVQVGPVAQQLEVNLETDYPGTPMPGEVHISY